MVNTIEELRKINIDRDRVTVFEILLCLGNGGLGAAMMPEPVTAVMKRRFKHRFHLEQNRLLDHTIDDIRNAQSTLTAAWFRYPNSADVTRLVRSGSKLKGEAMCSSKRSWLAP